MALQGLDRHVRASKALTEATKAASDKRNSIAVAMVAIINSQPTSAPEEQAHWWMVPTRLRCTAQSARCWSEGCRTFITWPEERSRIGHGSVHRSNSDAKHSLLGGHLPDRFDFAAMKPAFRMKLFVAVAQLLDQEVVGWYENESDKPRLSTGGMGGMGSMGGMGGGHGRYGNE